MTVDTGETVGFIGLGVLGSAIVPNLLAGDVRVVGYDIRDDTVAAMAGRGMAAAESVDEVAREGDVIFTCLPSAAAMLDVCAALAQTDGTGKLVVELSTMPVAEKERARDILAAAGYAVMDCPVSGNRMLAEKRRLTAFASGEAADFARVEPLLARFAERVFHVGPFGDGSKVKLCGNILNLVHNVAAAEVMVLAMKSGLDPKMFHQVISGSGSSSSMFESRGALMAADDYDYGGSNFSTPIKDAPTIAAFAATQRVPTPLYTAALQTYRAALAQGLGDQDAAAVIKVFERAAAYARERDE